MQNNDYSLSRGAGYTARGHGFHRVPPPERRLRAGLPAPQDLNTRRNGSTSAAPIAASSLRTYQSSSTRTALHPHNRIEWDPCGTSFVLVALRLGGFPYHAKLSHSLPCRAKESAPAAEPHETLLPHTQCPRPTDVNAPQNPIPFERKKPASHKLPNFYRPKMAMRLARLDRKPARQHG
jgi:hypothetical protein